MKTLENATEAEARLAKAFHAKVHEEFEPETLAETDDRNKSYGPGICATHDFTDANEVMAEAFEKAEGREIDLDSDADLDLWGNAWDVAKSVGFSKEWPSDPSDV